MLRHLTRWYHSLHQRHKFLHELNVVVAHKGTLAAQTVCKALEERWLLKEQSRLLRVVPLRFLSSQVQLFLFEENHFEQVQ